MSERLKEHDWKSCVRDERTVGSNPTLSAKSASKRISVIAGSCATDVLKPRQVRKEAAVEVLSVCRRGA